LNQLLPGRAETGGIQEFNRAMTGLWRDFSMELIRS